MTRACAVAALALAACYGPQIDPCTVHCPNQEACPADMTCGPDKFCHAAGDATDCSGAKFSVTIRKTGNGTGTVGGDGGLSCGTACSAQFAPGTTVNLTAMRDNDSRFVDWNDPACTGMGDTCVLVVDGDKSVDAEFRLAAPLTVAFIFVGGATGEVVSTPSGLDCTTDCTVLFDQNSQVTLDALSQNTFFGFDNQTYCPGPQQECIVTMNGPTTVTAEFDP